MWWDWHQVGTLIGVISALNGGFLWATKVLIENQRSAFAERVAAMIDANNHQDEDIAELARDLAAFKLSITEHYIRRDDWIVYVGRMEQKIDAIWGHLFTASQANNQAKSGGSNG